MDPESELIELYSNSSKNSPVKVFREPDAEESPPKIPMKMSRFNLKILQNWNSETKKAPADLYDRVKSHSSSRNTENDEVSYSFCRNLFQESNSCVKKRSLSRDMPARENYSHYNDSSSKEIEQLNSKIKNLIKEKNELRYKYESQNKYIQELKNKNKNRNKVNLILWFQSNLIKSK